MDRVQQNIPFPGNHRRRYQQQSGGGRSAKTASAVDAIGDSPQTVLDLSRAESVSIRSKGRAFLRDRFDMKRLFRARLLFVVSALARSFVVRATTLLPTP